VLYAGALLAELPVWENTREVARGLAGAAVFAVVLAAIGLVIAAFTPRRGLGVAAIVTVLLVLAGVGGIVAGIADEEGNDTVAGWAGLISPFSLVDGVQVWALGAETSTVEGPPGTAGGMVFAAAAVAIVAACYGLLLLRYRRVSVS
jgi:ABC-2 type transport system permease protein